MPEPPEGNDPLAREVERLLKKLPGADPHLRGGPGPAPAPRPAGVTSGPRGVVTPAAPPRRGPTPAGVWGRVAVAVVLAIGLTQWPYVTTCGWPVFGYLAAVGVLLAAALWAAVGAWRLHLGLAHLLALAVGAGAMIMAAGQILPRVGYAAQAATWSCRAAPAPAVQPLPAAPGTP